MKKEEKWFLHCRQPQQKDKIFIGVFMKDIFYKNQSNKGSTLLLAMVVISTVLLAGVGTAIILSRQVREISVVENSAVAFHMAQTIADGIASEEDDFEETENFISINWGWLERDIEYKAEEKPAGEYLVTLKIGSEYYEFTKKATVTESNGGDSIFNAYYKVPSEWGDDVTMRYQFFDYDGENDVVYDKMTSVDGDYPGWALNTIDVTNIEKIRTYFCDGKPEDVTGCQHDPGPNAYPNPNEFDEFWFTDIEDGEGMTVCVADGSENYCFFPEKNY